MAESMEVQTTKYDKDWSAYRFGQSFTESTVREIINRDPYGSLLTFELPYKALGNGFNLVNDEGEPLDNNDDIKRGFSKALSKIIDGVRYERGFGVCDYVIYKTNNPENKNKLFIKAFHHEQVDMIKRFNDGTIKEIKFWEADPDTGKSMEWEVKDMKDHYRNLLRCQEDWWKGRSYLEPIWDELQSLRAIRMGATLFAIRVGAGLKIIKIPEGTSKATITEMKTAAKTMESINGFFLLPLEEAEVTIETGSGMVDYHALKRISLEAITAYSGVPMATLIGIEMERQGGEYNEESEFDFLRDIQRSYEPVFKWALLRFSEYYEWGLTEDNFEFEWIIREELSDRAQAETDLIRAQADSTDITAGIKDADEVRSDRGLEGPAPEKPDMFTFGIKEEKPQDGESKSTTRRSEDR